MLNSLNKRVLYVILFTGIFISFSCTRKSDEVTDKTAANKASLMNSPLTQTDVNESAQDLLTTDYKKFYDELSPHGKWIKVKAEDIGLGKAGGKNESSDKPASDILNFLAGVNTAYAETDVDFGMFFVWQPSPDLTVAVSAGEPYVPYTDGRWVYSDAGWYYDAPTPCEEITHHYGRWVYSNDMGWVWIPGRVWAPAWVEWRDDDDYIAWRPLGPYACFRDNVFYDPYIDDPSISFVYVDRVHFCDDRFYSYLHWSREDPERFEHMKQRDGLVFVNNNVICRGPEVRSIEKITGKTFVPVRVDRVENFHGAGLSGNELRSYAPELKRHGYTKDMNPPKDYRQFSDVKNSRQETKVNNENGNKLGGLNTEQTGKKNQEFRDKQNDKQNRNKQQYSDKQQKKNRSDNSGRNKQNKDNNKTYKEPKSRNKVNDYGHNNDKVKVPPRDKSTDKGNNRGWKDNGHDNGSKHDNNSKGNDKGNGQDKSNSRGNGRHKM